MQPEEWQYQVISIRDANPIQGAQAAHEVYQYLTNKEGLVEDLPSKVIADKITVSDCYSWR